MNFRINFESGLTVITGETGAGKSIMLDAISLVLGQRADSKVLKDPKVKCIVEAMFDVSAYRLEPFFETHELDYEQGDLIVRRELSAKGKSRAFVNDTPVTLKVLQALMPQLIDLHLQFENLEINDQVFQIQLLDTLAGTTKAVDLYYKDYSRWLTDKRKLTLLKKEQAAAASEKDYLQFQYAELEDARIRIDEEIGLEAALKTQENVEEIQQTVGGFLQLMSEGEQPVLEQMRNFQYQLDKLGSYHEALQNFAERFQSQFLEMEELIGDLDNWMENIDVDPDKLTENRHRLDQINQLLNKHQCVDSKALLVFQENLLAKLDDTAELDSEIEALEKTISDNEGSLMARAKKISQSRLKKVKGFDKLVMDKLTSLKMSNARFHVHVEPGKMNPYGMDDIQFLFSANPGSDLAPIKEVASGGELSRLSLITKSMAAEHMHLPTLVFDEVDSGVSGDVAQRMGALLMDISNEHQVVCITHSAQIAAMGKTHLFVSKQITKNSTATRVDKLGTEERVNHVAVMLSSDPPTDSAILNARELLDM